MQRISFSIIACLISTLALSSVAHAQMSKDACLAAHVQAQDEKEHGKISDARKHFLTCAQATCPMVVQKDCAAGADQLSREQPTLSFVARDAEGADLPNTAVYIDEALVATRLDSGQSYDVDPGPRKVRFSNNGKDQVYAIVVQSGEKGRIVQATFGAAKPVVAPITTPVVDKQTVSAPAAASVAHRSHPSGSYYAMIGGGSLVVVGGALAAWSYTQVPSKCSLSSGTCEGVPGAPIFADASSAAKKFDIGVGVGAVGLAALTGGIIWYVTGGHSTESPKLSFFSNSSATGAAFMGTW